MQILLTCERISESFQLRVLGANSAMWGKSRSFPLFSTELALFSCSSSFHYWKHVENQWVFLSSKDSFFFTFGFIQTPSTYLIVALVVVMHKLFADLHANFSRFVSFILNSVMLAIKKFPLSLPDKWLCYYHFTLWCALRHFVGRLVCLCVTFIYDLRASSYVPENWSSERRKRI